MVYCGKQVILLTTEEQKRQEDLQRLRGLRPIDDDFMRCLFKDDIPLAELVLRIITGKQDLIITDCQTQKNMKRLAGARSICLDAYGTDATGKKYDLEIQRADKGADPHRARYHSSVMDVENLDTGQEFSELPDTYTIFIVEKDFYGMGKPVYSIERINLDTGKPFEDGEHILYVNGEYRGVSDIGKLMHDFSCTEANDMYFELIAERTRYLKENPKGVSEMCKVIEDMRTQERIETMTEIALRMLRAGKYALEEIVIISGLSLDEVKNLQTGIMRK
ncbi:MAG: hypothetical protein HFI84_00880 [Eubacterium sp.]|nr:hypothetical protein [Eubacterium sp.]